MSEFLKMFRAYGGVGRGSLFFCYRWLVFSHERVADAIPEEGLIYDLGCGYGIFSVYLALRGPRRKIVAVDASALRTRSAQRAAKSLQLDNISFAREDIFKIPLEPAQAVILNDVLHHLHSYAAQDTLLKSVCAALKPGGKLIIVDVAPRPRLKYWLGWLVDHVLYFSDTICYPDKEQLTRFLTDHAIDGLSVSPIDQGRPFSNVLFIGTKK